MSPMKLLIVDDDDILRQMLGRRFERSGLRVTEAASAAEALARAEQARPDVALLDLHLPDMSGVELLGKLKELLPILEVVMLTAHGSIETAIQAMRAAPTTTSPNHCNRANWKSTWKKPTKRRRWRGASSNGASRSRRSSSPTATAWSGRARR